MESQSYNRPSVEQGFYNPRTELPLNLNYSAVSTGGSFGSQVKVEEFPEQRFVPPRPSMSDGRNFNIDEGHAQFLELLSQLEQSEREINFLRGENVNIKYDQDQLARRYQMELAQLEGRLEHMEKDRDAWRQQNLWLNKQVAVQKAQLVESGEAVLTLHENVLQAKTSFNEQQRNLNKMVYYNQQLVARINKVKAELAETTELVTFLTK